MKQWNGVVPRAGADLEALNNRFHALINRAAESPRLIAMLRDTVRFIPEHFYTMLPEWSVASVRSHDAIVDAIEQGDVATARRVAEEHVREAGQLLTKYFNDHGYWSQPDVTDVPAS